MTSIKVPIFFFCIFRITNSVIAVAYATIMSFTHWSSFDLVGILLSAKVWRKLNRKLNRMPIHIYLLQICRHISNCMIDRFYFIHVTSSIPGCLNVTHGHSPVVPLETALNLAFISSDLCIFIAHGYGVAILRNLVFLIHMLKMKRHNLIHLVFHRLL